MGGENLDDLDNRGDTVTDGQVYGGDVVVGDNDLIGGNKGRVKRLRDLDRGAGSAVGFVKGLTVVA